MACLNKQQKTNARKRNQFSESSTHPFFGEEKEEPVLDKGYSWVILCCAVVLNIFMSGQFSTLGIYLVEFKEYFQESNSKISTVGACQMFVGYFMGVFNGFAMKRYGCRSVCVASTIMVVIGQLVPAFYPSMITLYIFFGVMSGIGYLNFYMTAVVIVQQYFSKKRAFATGICMAGLSIGVFIWAPFTRLMIEKYTWRGALIVNAGIYLNGFVCASLLRPQIKCTETEPIMPSITFSREYIEQVKTKKSIRCLPNRELIPFLLFLIGYFGIQLGHMTVYTYTPTRAKALDIPREKYSLLISIMGITGIFSRPVIGFVGDLKFSNRTFLIGLTGLIVGCLIMIATLFKSFLTLGIFSGLFGFFSSGYMALYGAALVDMIGITNIEVGGGVLMVSKGVANLTLNLLSGWLLDITGDVNFPFIVFGIGQAVGGCIIMIIPLVSKYFTKTEKCPDIEITNEIELNQEEEESIGLTFNSLLALPRRLDEKRPSIVNDIWA